MSFLFPLLIASILSLSTSIEFGRGICEFDSDCLNKNKLSKCDNYMCSCPNDFFVSDDLESCLQVQHYGESCRHSQQCSKSLGVGGICWKKRCGCKWNHHYLYGQCWETSRLNEPCQSDNNCYFDNDINAARCKDGTCQCNDGYYQREYRSCRRLASRIENHCLISLDCSIHFNETFDCGEQNSCESKFENWDSRDFSRRNSSVIHEQENRVLECSKNPSINRTCSNAQFYCLEKDECIAEIGEPCDRTDKVYITNSVCFKDHWQCKFGFTPSKDNRSCKKLTRQYEGSCETSEECLLFGPDAICYKEKCRCSFPFSRFNSDLQFCWVTQGVGRTCRDNRDCSVKSSYCNNGHCDCSPGTHLQFHTICVEDAKVVGDHCIDSRHCVSVPNSDCINNFCRCKDNFYASMGKCLTGLHAPCNSTHECTIEFSHCNEGKCVCYDGYNETSPDHCSKRKSSPL